MARPLRLEFPGALWHVTSRGNGREAIFRDDEDRLAFIDVLARVVAMFRWKLHAYVLMGNHYHLMVETPEPNLSRGMRQLNGMYTQRFNRSHGRVGHVLQGRFKGVLVEREAHLLELARYVVLNPVRAGSVKSAMDWRWSSFRATAGLSESPEWLDTSLLENFGRTAHAARAAYRRFVREGAAESYKPWNEMRNQVVLGSVAFERRLGRLSRAGPSPDEIPKRQRLIGRPGMSQILEVVAGAFGVLPERLRIRGGVAREAAAYLARAEGALKLTEIGTALRVRSWSASHLAAAGEKRLGADAVFRRRVEAARKRLQGTT
jgi:putative transposase